MPANVPFLTYPYSTEGLAAGLPTATAWPQFALYWATDTSILYWNDGASWQAIGGGGTVITLASSDSSLQVTLTGTAYDLVVLDSPAVGGITVTGTPSAGQGLIATSPTAAHWASLSGVASVFGRTGAVVAVDGDYYGVVANALPGANAGSGRWVGTTTTGPPTAADPFLVGDWVNTDDGHFWACTVAGSPGTWVDVAAGGGPWLMSGAGSPTPAGLNVTPYATGAVYQDLTNGAWFEATGPTSADWKNVGGAGDTTVTGVITQSGGSVLIIGKAGAQVLITDVGAIVGTYNGVTWDGADGNQTFSVRTGPAGAYVGIIQDASGNSQVPGIVTELGIATRAITSGALQTFQLISGAGAQLFTGATILAPSPPSLPLTVAPGNNLGFTLGNYGPFVLAPGTYTTIGGLITALQAAVAVGGPGTLSTYFDVQNVGGAISLTALAPFDTGEEVLAGPPFATAANPITAPVTVVAGVNDSFTFSSHVFAIAPGTYTTAADIIAAIQASVNSGASSFATFFEDPIWNVAGTMVIDAGVPGTVINSGAPFILAAAPPTLPLTVTTGVNDTFIGPYGDTVTVAAGTYATIGALITALTAADVGGPTLGAYCRIIDSAGTLLFVSWQYGVVWPFTTGPTDILASLGVTSGQAMGGSADFLATMGFTNGQTTGGADDCSVALGFTVIPGLFTNGIDPSRDFQLVIPVTYNPSAGDATCLIELSPDGTTYSAVATPTQKMQLAIDGTIREHSIYLPAGWYIRLTATRATIGAATFY